MSHNPVTCEGIIAIAYVEKMLQTGFSSFPVMNSAGNMIGIIPKNFLIVLVENHHWVDVSKLDNQQRNKLPKMFRRSSSDLSGEMGPAAYRHDEWFNEEPLRDDQKSPAASNSNSILNKTQSSNQ